MITIQSSYRIIKREEIDYGEATSSVETQIDYLRDCFYNEELLEGEFHDELEEREDIEEIDIDKIKENIRKQLYKEIEYEKANILDGASKEASQLKKESFEKGYKDGIKKGFLEGYEKGKEEAEKDCQEIKGNALDLFTQAEENVAQYFDENRTRIIGLAADMAESIIHKSIESSSENILMLIKPIVEEYRQRQQIIIAAHPNNYETLRDNLNQLTDTYEDTKFVILKDSSLEENGCTIENENQIIDLQIRKQLHIIIDKINDLE